MSLNKKIAKDSVKVTILGIIGQIFAFLTTILMARCFGTSAESDAFFLAFIFPAAGVAVFGGIIKIMLIPKMIYIRVNDYKQFPEFVSSSFLIFTFLSIFLSIIYYFGADSGLFFNRTASGIKQTTVTLLKTLLPLLPLMIIFNLQNALYTSYQKFAAAETVNFIKYLIVFSFLLIFYKSLGIHSLALGYILGQLTANIIFYFIIKNKTGFRFDFSFKSSTVKSILSLSIWPFLTSLVLQIEPLSSRIIASFLPIGSVSSFGYAERLSAIPGLIIGSGFLSVLVSHWSKTFAKGDTNELRRSINISLSYLITLLIPMVIGIYILRYPLIEFIFKNANFNANSVKQTAEIFALLIISIPLIHIINLFYRVTHVHHNFTFSFLVSLLRAIFMPALAMIFSVTFNLGPKGIALSIVLCAFFQLLLFYFFIQKRYQIVSFSSLTKTFVKTALASIFMGWVVNCANVNSTQGLFLFSILGFLIFITLMLLLRSSEVILLFKLIKQFI